MVSECDKILFYNQKFAQPKGVIFLPVSAEVFKNNLQLLRRTTDFATLIVNLFISSLLIQKMLWINECRKNVKEYINQKAEIANNKNRNSNPIWGINTNTLT